MDAEHRTSLVECDSLMEDAIFMSNGVAMSDQPSANTANTSGMSSVAWKYNTSCTKRESVLVLEHKFDSVMNMNSSIKSSSTFSSNEYENKLDPCDLDFIKVLGRGKFGKVMLAENKRTEELYAVKVQKKDAIVQDHLMDYVMTERDVLVFGSKCQFLPSLYSCFQTQSHIFFVMEYINGGNLIHQIRNCSRFDEERAKFYTAEIIIALQFLHENRVIHRDLKSDNVLLDQDGHCKLVDFGLCKKEILGDASKYTFCGTPRYTAPEMICGLKYGSSVDWWSLGILLFEMLTGIPPFNGDNRYLLYKSILHNDVFFPDFLSPESVSIIAGLLTKDPALRLGGTNQGQPIKNHTFFRHLDWDAIELRHIEPPFKPKIIDPKDTSNFDVKFTREDAFLTPEPNENVMNSFDQAKLFGFSFINDDHFTDQEIHHAELETCKSDKQQRFPVSRSKSL